MNSLLLLSQFNYIILALLIILSVVSFHQDRWASNQNLKNSWKYFCFMPVYFFIIPLLLPDRPLESGSLWPKLIMTFPWLLFTTSICQLSLFLLGSKKGDSNSKETKIPPTPLS